MAKAKASLKDSHKITFGTRKKGKAAKRRNKHDHSETNYRGQGR
jgi:hypothetical protein